MKLLRLCFISGMIVAALIWAAPVRVVLGTYEAQLLYNWAEIGTLVSIRY